MHWPTSGASSADMQSNRHTWNERKKYKLQTYLLNQDFEYIYSFYLSSFWQFCQFNYAGCANFRLYWQTKIYESLVRQFIIGHVQLSNTSQNACC
jgi:hypothetical protein